MKTTYFAVMLLLTLAVACNPAAKKDKKEKIAENAGISKKTIDNDRLIVPGKQIGAIYLGQDMKAVFDLLGKADEGDAAMGSALGIWKKDSLAIFSSYRDSNMVVKAVKQISSASSSFNTAEQIHTGVKLAQLTAVWPALKKVTAYLNEKTGDTLQVYDDIAAGIAFDVQKGLCTTITVHTKNKAVNSSYLSLHPGWKNIQ